MQAICMTDCQIGKRFYQKGEPAEVAEGQPLPAHFAWPGATSFVHEGEPLPAPRHERILILGDAPALHADVDALALLGEYSVMGINLSPFRWQWRMDYWASLHGSMFHDSRWMDIWSRCPWSEGATPHIITGRGFHGLNHGFSLVHCDLPGGSAYLAIKAAAEMGYKQIFVAGIDALSPGYAHFAQPLRHLAASLRKAGSTIVAVSGALLEV